ncbi:MAG TPA: VOC family protein [Myxococcaceae bacterium]|nr:VOC family protein [Myxococcaceae bacterium]
MRLRPILRVARPTDDLRPLVQFYRDGLGFSVLGSFEDHAGFDGVMLGHPGAPYHLEFTHRRGHRVGRAPSPDHLLVLYLPENAAWQRAVRTLRRRGLEPVRSENPYWEVDGLTFEDPDGYRVVLQHGAWRESRRGTRAGSGSRPLSPAVPAAGGAGGRARPPRRRGARG